MKFHSSGRAKAYGVIGLSIVASLSLVMSYSSVKASDHDDGESDLKVRSLNLTDLYVFKESSQDSAVAGDTSLIFIMNTNPRSVARYQYYFNTNARYEFHINRQTAVTNSPLKSASPDGDVILRFEFSAPTAGSRQTMTVTLIRDGAATAGSVTGLTSNIQNETTVNTISFGTATESTTIQVFAGLREDPFFFDVERYFRVRAGLLSATGVGPAGNPVVTFRGPAGDSTTGAIDFAKGYNVNSIVVRVPRALLQSAAAETVFDVWETTSI